VITPGSHCDACGHKIRVRDNIPVLSYLWLRGKCRDCGAPIPRESPWIEALGGMLAWLCLVRFVPDLVAFDVGHIVAAIGFFGFLCLLVVETLVDVRHHIIPDETSIYAAPFGLVLALTLHALGYDGWLALTWKESIVGAVVGGGFFAITAAGAMFVLRREGLGWGDVKLMAMIGAFLGPFPGAFVVLLVGSLTGSFVALGHLAWTRRRTYVPVGPSLAWAAALYVLWGDVLLHRFFPGLEFIARYR
jgi:leader peptidase (prepilin peptidase)/N-methyltransferase